MTRIALVLIALMSTVACSADDAALPSAGESPNRLDTSTGSAGGSLTTATTPETTPSAAIRDGSTVATPEDPPPVLVSGDGVTLTLEPWTYCWSGGALGTCADGAPPEDPPLVEGEPALTVVFPVKGWGFQAITRPGGDPCGREQRETLDVVDEHSHRLVPQGRAGLHNVTLFGRGPEGSVFVTFQWRTETDGIAPMPTARVTVVSDAATGVPRSVGAEIVLSQLADTPSSASAEVTMTAADGPRRRRPCH